MRRYLGRYDRSPRSGDVRHVAQLERDPFLERVECVKNLPRGEAICTWYQYDRPLLSFRASSAQVKKIKSGKGKINITLRMMDRGRR